MRARVSLPLDENAPDAPRRQLDYGQHVEIEARVRAPHNYNNPGGFDYVTYLARQHIFWTAVMTSGSKAEILPGRCGSRFLSLIYRIRSAALQRLDRLYSGDPYTTAMMDGILIGETSGLERVWTEEFRRTGTFHALVISGIHVTVLAGVLLFLLRLGGAPELGALAITAAAAWLYALVSGMSAPVVRAAAGFSLFLIARFLFRRTQVLNLLAAVALVYALWDPDALFDASFQLSFLSVAAIGALAAPLLSPRLAPLSRGVRDLNDTARDAQLLPLALRKPEWNSVWPRKLFALWSRIPQRAAEAASRMVRPATPLRRGNGHRLHRHSNRPRAPHGRVFPSRIVHGFNRESSDLSADGGGSAAWLRGGLHRIAHAGRACGLALENSPRASPAGTQCSEPSWRVPDPPLWLAARRSPSPCSPWLWPPAASFCGDPCSRWCSPALSCWSGIPGLRRSACASNWS